MTTMKATREQIKMLGRLKRRSDFLSVQAAQRKWVSPTMIVQIADIPDSAGRFGLTVTKKTSASSVVRNRIRRRLRAIAADVLPLYDLAGKDLVLIGRTETEKTPYESMQKDLAWCLKRLDVVKKA